MRDEMQHLKETERHEREMLMLRWENERLRSERRLGPGDPSEEGH